MMLTTTIATYSTDTAEMVKVTLLWNAYDAAHYAYEDHRNYCSGCAHLWYTNKDYACTTRDALRTTMLQALKAWEDTTRATW